MWTPKRILIYLTALFGFLAVFGVAVTALGWVDGLPPLPPHYAWDPNAGGGGGPGPNPGPVSERDAKIIQAFGNECEEYKRLSKVWLPSKGAVLAIDKFEIIEGRVKLTPFSAGLFPKNKGDQRFPEITTVQSPYAFLTLDRPITSLTELSRSKVVAVELGGDKGVKIKNNRKTQELNDDLEMYVTEGKLFYEDARNLIWSDGYVKLLDTQSQPPTQITAIGLQVNLSKDVSPNRDKKTPAQKTEGFSGVEKITLLSNVDMHFYIDARSGFMTGPEELAKKNDAKAEPQEKAHVQIKTNGKHVYIPRAKGDDFARFDAPEQTALAHDRVIVTRHRNAAGPKGEPATDVLDCDRLDLQFRKKAAGDPASNDKDIESAIATAKPGEIVELILQSEEMHAVGAEMRYFAPIPTSGPRTIIKGSPMRAARQGHEIECEELHLKGADKLGNGQEAFAKGPGKIDLLDKQTGRASTHILFRNSFAATKDKDGDHVYDLLTLRGDPAFIDDERKQELRAAQFLHVWLEDVKVEPAKPGEPASKRQRPHKIEGFEKVQLRSPQLNILETNHLTVCFREQKAPSAEKAFDGVPAFSAIGAPPAKATPVGLKKTDNQAPTVGFGLTPSQNNADSAKSESEKPKKPIEMTAGEITAYVATIGNTNELLEFVAEGTVHVTQEADNPKDKGLEITGNILKLVRQPLGDVLSVFGDASKVAQLRFNEMYLWGPDVMIDQAQNVAIVPKGGSMHMPSNTTLDGKQKDGHIRIDWNKRMWFNGRYAEFDGGVQAFQGNGTMTCIEMQVTLDKPVHFKQSKESQTAKVDKILCNGKDREMVFIHEREIDASGKIITDRRLYLPSVEVDNLDQRLKGSGPNGVLDFIGRSSDSDPGIGPNSAAKDANRKAGDGPLKWTRIRFNGNMLSRPTEGGGGRQTSFTDSVRVFHQPGDNPLLPDPVGTMGKDGLFLSCQKLTVIQRKVGEKSSQEMLAEGGAGLAAFQTEKFHGSSKTVKFDEARDTIVFDGSVTIYEMPKVQGARPREIRGDQILYNRKTGAFNIGGGREISW